MYNPHAIAERLAEEGGRCVTLCSCSGHCKCTAPTPKFEWKQQAEMPECRKYIMAKLKAAGVVDLSCCLSYEQLWQRFRECIVKVLRKGGETGMIEQRLHVTNQVQSVQKHV